MIVVEEIDAARDAVREARRQGRRSGLVPTMGALHSGHVSLIGTARSQCDFVAATIFVNPTQFGPQEDFGQYPRTLEGDLAKCREAGADLVFVPTTEAMYPEGTRTTVSVSQVTDVLCGPRRPGHFDGVATVVAKLFGILPTDMAYFGEKDYQQLVVIRQMARDLNIGMQIIGCPTVREADGLAMSSRNAYLTEPERKQAASISRGLFAARNMVACGERVSEVLASRVRTEITDAGEASIEYVEVADPDTLASVALVDGPARICVAVRIGKCRLIDNVAVDGSPPAE